MKKEIKITIGQPDLKQHTSYPDGVVYVPWAISGKAITVDRYDLVLMFPVLFFQEETGLVDNAQLMIGADFGILDPNEMTLPPYLEKKKIKRKGGSTTEVIDYKKDFAPIAGPIGGYELSKSERVKIQSLIVPEVSPELSDYIGDLLKKILEEAGFTVSIVTQLPDEAFPSPTGTALVTAAFSIGMQKGLNPIVTKDGYKSEITYLSIEKPKSKTSVQLKLWDDERLREYQKLIGDHLSPYGLKCLYLAIAECGRNNRTPWFILDTNHCLDLLGYERNKKNVHYPRNKNRLLKELSALTQISFNVERRAPKYGKSGKDTVIKFSAPLLSITGRFEEWEVDSDKPIETGIQIEDNIQIFLHPQIYKDIGMWYTFIPYEYLTIDTGRNQHAILLYPYIANQWRIGWHKYHGVIKQPMHQILDGSGLLDRMPRRANQQRDFIEKIKETLRWLKGQREYWIKSVRIESKNRPWRDHMITITMADDHPLKTSMKKQISEK